MAGDDYNALAVMFLLFATIGITGNVLVIVAISRTPWLRTPMNYLLVNLAVSDIIISIFVLPRYVFFHSIQQDAYLCKFITGGSLIVIGTIAEGFTLIAITIERYIAVVLPHTIGARITVKKLRYIVPMCWFISVIAGIPTITSLTYHHDNNKCFEDWPMWFEGKANACINFVLGISSVVAMTTLNSLIISSLWSPSNGEATHNARIKMRKKVTKMLIIISNFHAICRIPNCAVYLAAYVLYNAARFSTITGITVLLILINSASHPFLMCLHLESFRKAVRRLVGLGRSSTVNPTNQVNESSI